MEPAGRDAPPGAFSAGFFFAQPPARNAAARSAAAMNVPGTVRMQHLRGDSGYFFSSGGRRPASRMRCMRSRIWP